MTTAHSKPCGIRYVAREFFLHVSQVKACADVGADLVRITVQGMQEAKACAKIRERLFQDGCVAERRC